MYLLQVCVTDVRHREFQLTRPQEVFTVQVKTRSQCFKKTSKRKMLTARSSWLLRASLFTAPPPRPASKHNESRS